MPDENGDGWIDDADDAGDDDAPAGTAGADDAGDEVCAGIKIVLFMPALMPCQPCPPKRG